MKYIEQKLTSDAHAFKHNPDAKLHDNIMRSIIADTKKPATQNFTFYNFTLYKWLVPTSMAVIALLVVVIFNSSNNEISVPEIQEIANNPVEFNIDMLALNIESRLTSNIQLEQEAIVNDLNYLKSLLVL